MTNVLFDRYLINFGFASKAEKKALLQEYAHLDVFMDLTCFDPAEFYQQFPQLKGSFAALFCDQEKRMEIHWREFHPAVEQQLMSMGFRPTATSIVSCGFIFPRTIVQIINEAYFALTEGVASQADIDRAMRFGVNYPKGPFEWARGQEQVVKTLLLELLAKTQDQRYRPCPLLG
jgi:3-hydroxybutyryl-CoA dehydrogenase